MWALLIIIVTSMILGGTARAGDRARAVAELRQINAGLSTLCVMYRDRDKCREEKCPWTFTLELDLYDAWTTRKEILNSLSSDRAVAADDLSPKCKALAKQSAQKIAKMRGHKLQTAAVVPKKEKPPSPELLVPEFPWPPPGASSDYVLPDKLFESHRTVGAVVAAIISALERNGYVERSFFRTQTGGIALVTRLERIKDDGSSFAESGRWPPSRRKYPSTDDLYEFLRGLFFVDPGHYRVIVFILDDLPFSQSSEKITGKEARLWLKTGANILPPEISARPFGDGHCTALIYEFSSDGYDVRVSDSPLTGKQHLEKAGVLSLLEKTN